MKETYSSEKTYFAVYIHDQKKPPVGCGYYYTVTYGSFAHTAFRTKRALKLWLKETGLKLGARNGRCIKLEGHYHRHCHMMDMAEFFKTFGRFKPLYVLDNGDYTIGFIEETKDGNIWHLQNCNTDRPILERYKISQHIETGIPARWIYK